MLWPLLAFAARSQEILSYNDVQGFTGIDQRGLAKSLGMIHRYCQRYGYPFLNVIVVTRKFGLPGHGIPAKGMSQQDMLNERSRVFVFDWSSKPKPRARDFK